MVGVGWGWGWGGDLCARPQGGKPWCIGGWWHSVGVVDPLTYHRLQHPLSGNEHSGGVDSGGVSRLGPVAALSAMEGEEPASGGDLSHLVTAGKPGEAAGWTLPDSMPADCLLRVYETRLEDDWLKFLAAVVDRVATG